MCQILVFKHNKQWIRIRHRQWGGWVSQTTSALCLSRALFPHRCFQYSALDFSKWKSCCLTALETEHEPHGITCFYWNQMYETMGSQSGYFDFSELSSDRPWAQTGFAFRHVSVSYKQCLMHCGRRQTHPAVQGAQMSCIQVYAQTSTSASLQMCAIKWSWEGRREMNWKPKLQLRRLLNVNYRSLAENKQKTQKFITNGKMNLIFLKYYNLGIKTR